ncbi:N-acetyltransferase [Capnocytophaga canis]|uniref:GNAT family N-acetyltransferase n=1 Tax=Capnocytophaga canis TaxID=1848903 RepID=UPI001561CAF5|nr:GNAT family N-acetyltransferase [Capnocytophaga canis]GIM61043.1 N-acetyltransferase [Capnocytophaga canis]
MNTFSDYHFRIATTDDFSAIWEIILFAKEIRKQEGSSQWQDGYPNEATIFADIQNKYGYVVEFQSEIVGYFAFILGAEPAYESIDGKWVSEQPYAVVHRMAVSAKGKGKGLSKRMLQKAAELSVDNNRFSLRIDTNFDNIPMLRSIQTLGYVYCGEVYFRGSARKAFEKVLR